MATAKQVGVGQGGERNEPTPYPVTSSVLHWRPDLSRFYLRVQRSNENKRKQRAVNRLKQHYSFEDHDSRFTILAAIIVNILYQDDRMSGLFSSKSVKYRTKQFWSAMFQ